MVNPAYACPVKVPPDLMTTIEAAEFLNVPVDTLSNMRSRRTLKPGPACCKIGKLWFYRRSTLERWKRANS